jgi:hypothetical protein
MEEARGILEVFGAFVGRRRISGGALLWIWITTVASKNNLKKKKLRAKIKSPFAFAGVSLVSRDEGICNIVCIFFPVV